MSQVADRLIGPPAPPPVQHVPFISVLVPVRNEAAFIGETLAQLLGQDYPPDRFEVLVADGESDDQTPEIVRAIALRSPNVRLVNNPGRLSSAGRNAAARAARGEVLLVIDGHCEIANPRYLREVADAFARSGADCLGRPQPLDVRGATCLQRAIAAARSSRLGHHPASHIYSDREGFVPPQSVAVAYRRDVFERVGYFDERFDACEDCELNHRVARAGLSCFFTPRIAVRYHPRDSLTRLFRQMVRYGRGRIRLLRKHPDTLSVGSLVPGAFVAGALTGPLLTLAWPLLWWAYLGTLALYSLLLVASGLRIAWQQREPALAPLVPLVLMTVHAGAGWGAWFELLTGRRNRAPDLGTGAVPEPTRLTFQLPRPTPPAKRGPSSPTRPLNALTIDVEDYFQVSAFEHVVAREDWGRYELRVARGTDRLLDLLAAADVRATFFVLGWVAERRPGLVRAIRSAGHEVGCHSHEHRLIYTQTQAAFREDLRRGLGALQGAIGEKVTAYRAPSFSITKASLWALDVLIEEGITLDSSIYPTHHDRYGIPGTPLGPYRIERPAGSLWEFPPPVWQFLRYPVPVGGGGYLRLYPYWMTRRGLGRINAAGRPFAAYLHPWELDPDQPRLRPGLSRSLRHYVNLRRTEPRLERLVTDFRFAPLSESLAEYAPESRARDAATPRRAA